MIKGLAHAYRSLAAAALTALVTAGCNIFNPPSVKVEPAVRTPRSYSGVAQTGPVPTAERDSRSSRSGY